MLIERYSPVSKKVVSLEVGCTPQELEAYLTGNKLIQNALPNISAGEREFILSGVTPEEWEKIFPPEEEEEEADVLSKFFDKDEILGE